MVIFLQLMFHINPSWNNSNFFDIINRGWGWGWGINLWIYIFIYVEFIFRILNDSSFLIFGILNYLIFELNFVWYFHPLNSLTIYYYIFINGFRSKTFAFFLSIIRRLYFELKIVYFICQNFDSSSAYIHLDQLI